jgi:hypothetical protein
LLSSPDFSADVRRSRLIPPRPTGKLPNRRRLLSPDAVFRRMRLNRFRKTVRFLARRDSRPTSLFLWVKGQTKTLLGRLARRGDVETGPAARRASNSSIASWEIRYRGRPLSGRELRSIASSSPLRIHAMTFEGFTCQRSASFGGGEEGHVRHGKPPVSG